MKTFRLTIYTVDSYYGDKIEDVIELIFKASNRMYAQKVYESLGLTGNYGYNTEVIDE